MQSFRFLGLALVPIDIYVGDLSDRVIGNRINHKRFDSEKFYISMGDDNAYDIFWCHNTQCFVYEKKGNLLSITAEQLVFSNEILNSLQYEVGDKVAIRCCQDGYVFTIRTVVSKDGYNDKVTLSNDDIIDATNLVDATYGRDKSYYYSFATDALLAEFEHNLALVRQNNPLNQTK